jgi:hypothetical protein
VTVVAPPLPSLVELDIAMARIDDALLHLCLLGDLIPSGDRHQIRNDLAAAVAAVVTHRRLHAAEVR